MKTICINEPENVDFSTFEYAMVLASKLYQDGKLSAGQAAHLIGVSKRTFIETLASYGVSFMSTSADDLLRDIENA